VPVDSLCKVADCEKMLSQSHFLLSQPKHILTFLHPILMCRVRWGSWWANATTKTESS